MEATQFDLGSFFYCNLGKDIVVKATRENDDIMIKSDAFPTSDLGVHVLPTINHCAQSSQG